MSDLSTDTRKRVIIAVSEDTEEHVRTVLEGLQGRSVKISLQDMYVVLPVMESWLLTDSEATVTCHPSVVSDVQAALFKAKIPHKIETVEPPSRATLHVVK